MEPEGVRAEGLHREKQQWYLRDRWIGDKENKEKMEKGKKKETRGREKCRKE